ncbi:MAG: hypothetical protein AAGA58_10060 [Verrucomicrobiota bacterium]
MPSKKAPLAFAFLSLILSSTYGAMITHTLNVEIVQVLDDSGGNATPLIGSDGGSYIYSTQVNEIFNQAGIQVTFTQSTWRSTDAQRLTVAEMESIFDDTFSGSGDPLPAIPVDSVQVFFVMDHPGTGYDGSSLSGWANDGSFDPISQARNSGINQLFIDGTFVSNGRGVMTNQGFTVDQLSGTIAHELAHALGLRHIEDINNGDAAGTIQDPSFTTPTTEPNLVWGAGFGPAYDGSLDNDPMLTTLQENYFLNQQQIDAMLFNGVLLDPDGNGIGVLQVIPEPSAAILAVFAVIGFAQRRRRSRF